ncbi:MAG: hypothetical protein ACJAQ7_001028 [Sediminicola sp.]|jgi:hypothetical protein
MAKEKIKKRQKKALLNCGKVVGLQPETAHAVEWGAVERLSSLEVLEHRI